jgi:hypothetical protein
MNIRSADSMSRRFGFVGYRARAKHFAIKVCFRTERPGDGPDLCPGPVLSKRFVSCEIGFGLQNLPAGEVL